MSETIHYACGQKYDSYREDGRRVEMVPIACQGTRVYLPKGHRAIHTDVGVNCKVCIEKLIECYRDAINHLEDVLPLSNEDKTEFKITKKERSRRAIKQLFSERREIDHEAIERIRCQ